MSNPLKMVSSRPLQLEIGRFVHRHSCKNIHEHRHWHCALHLFVAINKVSGDFDMGLSIKNIHGVIRAAQAQELHLARRYRTLGD